MADEKKKIEPDVTLADGREVFIDLSKITVKAWREYVRAETQPEDDDAMLSKLTGLAPEEIENLSYLDWRKLDKAFAEKIRNPLATTG
jgi:hypothetical protein